jgi:hypothetical protein
MNCVSHSELRSSLLRLLSHERASAGLAALAFTPTDGGAPTAERRFGSAALTDVLDAGTPLSSLPSDRLQTAVLFSAFATSGGPSDGAARAELKANQVLAGLYCGVIDRVR